MTMLRKFWNAVCAFVASAWAEITCAKDMNLDKLERTERAPDVRFVRLLMPPQPSMVGTSFDGPSMHAGCPIVLLDTGECVPCVRLVSFTFDAIDLPKGIVICDGGRRLLPGLTVCRREFPVIVLGMEITRSQADWDALCFVYSEHRAFANFVPMGRSLYAYVTEYNKTAAARESLFQEKMVEAIKKVRGEVAVRICRCRPSLGVLRCRPFLSTF